MRVLLKKPGQFAVGSATQSGAGLLDLNFLNSDATLSNTITHSRAGNATMVDSDGLIKWAPHNLFTYSEDFTQWNNADTTDSVSSTVAAPDGSFATEIFETTANDVHSIRDTSLTLSAQVYTHSCFVKYNGRHIQLRPSGEGNGFAFANFDLLNGVVGNSGGSNLQSATIESYGDGWYLCSISVLHTASGTGVIILNCKSPLTDGEAFATSDLVYTGDITKGFYIYGAHLYRSDLGGMVDVPAGERVIPSASTYVPTTSAARYLPRVGHHVYNGSAWVNEGVLAESEARTNLLTYSNDFTDASWIKTEVTITADSAPSPDGGTTASKLVESSNSSAHSISVINLSVSSGVAQTISVFAKSAGDGRYITLRSNQAGTDDWIVVDLSDGSITESSTGQRNEIVQDVGNGWYLLSMTFDSTSTSAGMLIGLSNTPTPATGAPIYTGDGTSGVYIYGAQFEQAPTPSSYIPTAGSTVTRAAETFTIPAANLPWPTETYGPELVTNGDFATNDFTDWSVFNDADADASTGAAEFGKTVGGSDAFIRQYVPTVAGKQYVITFEVTAGSGRLEVRDGGGGGLATYTSVTLGYKTVYFNANDTTLDLRFYHRTEGVTVTLDNISVRELTRYPVSIQMNGRLTWSDSGSDNPVPLRWVLSSSDSIEWYYSGPQDQIIVFKQEQNNVQDTVLGPDPTYTPGILVPFNIASRHGMTFINGAVDGVALTANTTPTNLPDLSATDLNLAYTFMGTVERFRVWGLDLGDGGIEGASS